MKIDSMMRLHASIGNIPKPPFQKTPSQTSGHQSLSHPKTPSGPSLANGHSSLLGSRDAAIVVDDFPEVLRPAKKQRIDLSSNATYVSGGPLAPAMRNSQTFHGCTTCMSHLDHPATMCPVVRAGPESIEM